MALDIANICTEICRPALNPADEDVNWPRTDRRYAEMPQRQLVESKYDGQTYIVLILRS